MIKLTDSQIQNIEELHKQCIEAQKAAYKAILSLQGAVVSATGIDGNVDCVDQYSDFFFMTASDLGTDITMHEFIGRAKAGEDIEAAIFLQNA